MLRHVRFHLVLYVSLTLATLGIALVWRSAEAGGPILVGGPNNGIAGQPFTWNLASLPNQAIQYRVDGGPLSALPDGTVVISNSQGIARVQGMFQTWQNVNTTTIAYNNAGLILATGSFLGGDVKTVQDFNAVFGSCQAGQQSPIVFDADGSIIAQLIGNAAVIGFAAVCDIDPTTGHILAGLGLLNGQMQDGINTPPTNFELTTNQFNQAFVHEFGHFSGLDHSQINVDVLSQRALNCNLDEVAGLPVLFPFFHCQDRVTAGLPPLAPDDMAWISKLYPVTGTPPAGKMLTSAAYGTISGNILFSDSITLAQGVNVIARQVDNPATSQNESLRMAVSVVSGYRFTGNPGQAVTCSAPDPTNPECNVGGSPFGSRDPLLIGTYDIPVPPGTYTVQVESVFRFFRGGSRVGPLSPPIPMPGQAPTPPQVSVTAGNMVTVNIVLQGTPPRFDSFESAWLEKSAEPVAWLRERFPGIFR